nr:SAM-dependent chlorinase/fluorinase [Dissulfurirhabdus thermomarina]
MPLVGFLSDFGLADTYVGSVKGVLLGLNPALRVVDLTHAVPPQDVAAGAFALASACGDFPPGTVFLAVVDPGVGTDRAGIVAATDRHFFVGPDNGLLALALRRGGARAIHRLAREDLYRRPVSPTFHGRDVFAPAAAHLTLGTPPEAFGPPHLHPAPPPWPEPEPAPGGLRGRVVHVDRFGNLVTNIDLSEGPLPAAAEVGGRLAPFRRTYADAAPGELLALAGSHGFLEVAAREASAAAATGAARGSEVRARFAPTPA